MWKKIWSLILALTMLSSLSATGFAVENKDSTDAGERIVLGTLEDDEGTPEYFAKQDAKQNIMLTRAGDKELFTMTANKVYDLLTTSASGDKYIRKWDLDGHVEFYGELSYSEVLALDYKIRAGLCTYNASDGVFETGEGLYLDFESGVEDSYEVKSLSQYFVYYGFINNMIDNDRTYVSGELTFVDVAD